MRQVTILGLQSIALSFFASDRLLMLPTISTAAAESTILNLVLPLDRVESVDLAAASGRILAATMTAKLDFPHWDNSAMDGYAVKYADLAAGATKLRVTMAIPAGTPPQGSIASGEAARIYTGAMLPAGADTIVMQEQTTRTGDIVKISILPQLGDFVRKQGEYASSGTEILPVGTRLNPPELAILAACGCDRVAVYRQPRVAILSTGDELVPIDRPLQAAQIIDSNHYALSAFVRQAGGIPHYLGIIADDRHALTAAIQTAIASADIVLSTGGVSVGDYDYVDEVLAELGGDIRVTSVAMQPGKPLTVAKFPHALYFGLPGNPVSALVSCWRFVAPAIDKLSGLPVDGGESRRAFALTTTALTTNGQRERYIWGTLKIIDREYRFTPASGSKSSGNLINLAGTNALAIVPVGTTAITAGDRVEVWLC